jgi:hypothetical protein
MSFFTRIPGSLWKENISALITSRDLQFCFSTKNRGLQMKTTVRRFAKVFFALLGVTIFQTGCGIASYPGQPGLVTNNYSKIDLEDLETEGLYVYEVSYDNTPNGAGVGAIVTKLYPGAQTNTSNVRTNADGTTYKVKGQYNGAVVEMISLPAQNQIMLPTNTTVRLMTSYANSLDEIDDINKAEADLLTGTKLTESAVQMKKMRWDLLKAARFTANGSLSYEVTAIELDKQKFVPSKTISVETSVLQNGIKTSLDSKLRTEAAQFLEANFPKGFKGIAKVYLKGVNDPMPLPIGLHTPKTAEAAGIHVLRNVRPEVMKATLEKIAKR